MSRSISCSVLRSGLIVAGLGGLGLAACSIPDTAFHPSADAAGGGDSVSSVLAIRTSVASFDVDEGSTSNFTVRLSQAPSAELIVKVAPADADSATRIGISVPELRFEPTNFDQPQAVTITGLVDVDAVDGLAGIALSATGLDPVTVSATVRDHDKVEIATDISGSILSVQETRTAAVKVHLTHQPAADVRVKVMLGAGPVTVAPSEVTFTAADYGVDQTFTFTAPDDANIVSEDESLTFQATGLPDRLYTIHDVDKDVLNISVTTPNNASLSVPEGGSVQIGVALTKQPAANTTVHLELQSGNVALGRTDLTFTPLNFDQAQSVTVSAPQDVNTSNELDQITLSIPGSGVTPVTVGVTTVDDDVQAIIEDAPDPLSVTENQTATFGVTLKFQPTADIIVTVGSVNDAVATASPGTLTFTALNYNDPTVHRVTVRGTDDNNLAANSTSIKLHEATLVDKLVPVTVADDDTQAIVLSTATLRVPEGSSATFDVSLKFDPGTTVTVNLANTNQTALPIDKTSITFTAANYSTPVSVKVSPPIDNNDVSETATVTVSGAGAPTPGTVMLSASDSTVVQNWGWPTAFPGTLQIPAGFVYAYQVNVGAVANLNTFHTILSGAAGTYTMALYTDNGGVPGALVASGAMLTPKVAAIGVNDSDPLAMPPQLNAPVYWIAIRFSQTNTIGYASPAVGFAGQTGRQCLRNVNVDISLPWPSAFNGATCQTDYLFNMWITTFHQ